MGKKKNGRDLNLTEYQNLIWKWCLSTFEGIINWRTRKERTYRFLEEAIELSQALELSKEDVLKVVDYVYNRPVGQPKQEVGGVMITLLALCANEGIDCQKELINEYLHIITPEMTMKIRDKQMMKKQALI
jgi:hypothetical protein